jgi:RNA polymerase sigma-70 factor, ECF subfamily
MTTADQKKEKFISAYNEYSDEIFRYCFYRVFDREKARELSQETFMKVWRYLQEHDIDQLRAFLYKTAYHLIVDNSKKNKENSLEKMMETGFDVIDHKNCNKKDYMDVMAIKEEIAKLDEKSQEIMQLRFFSDLPLVDIAKVIGQSENHVAVKIHRILKKLKINLE